MSTFLTLVLTMSALLVGISLLFGHLIGRVGDLNNIHTEEVQAGFDKIVTNFVIIPDQRKINLPKY